MENFFNATIPVADFRGGCCEDCNGGHYVWRAQFSSPIPGVYYYREIASFHGDLQPFPAWEEVTLPEYRRLFDYAIAENKLLAAEDLHI